MSRSAAADETWSSLSHKGRSGAPAEEQTWGLVVLGCPSEPERVGEIFLLPRQGGGEVVLGRGPGEVAEARRRLSAVRQRPGLNEHRPPLSSPRLSRRQLVFKVSAAGSLSVTNAGRRRLKVRGEGVTAAALEVGDVVEVEGELLLLVCRRATAIPAWPALLPCPHHPFGAADPRGIVGESPATWELRRQIAYAAQQRTHLLILGPSGSGKELVAQAVHAASSRGRRPLISRNAAGIPEGLIEAELFGNVRNYPNVGSPERPGMIGEADGTTLFLDEIGELPPHLQANLLRVMDHGEYTRLGEPRPRTADVRIVAATNRPPAQLKYDVLARFPTQLVVGGLEQRPEDVPLLARHVLRRIVGGSPWLVDPFELEAPFGTPRLSFELITSWVGRAWTTHTRELEFLLRRALERGQGPLMERAAEPEREPQAPWAPPPLDPPTPPAAELAPSPFSRAELARLEAQRRYGFSATRCARADDYPGERQAASRHLRALMARALIAAGWDIEAALSTLLGEEVRDPEVDHGLRRSLTTWLHHLAARDDVPSLPQLRRTWGQDAERVQAVIEALRSGALPLPPLS